MLNINPAIALLSRPAATLIIEEGKRHQGVVELLRKLNLQPDPPPPDFRSIYVYTLVEYSYGKGKPQKILELFNQEEIKTAFRQAFESGEFESLLQAGDRYIEGYALGDDIREQGIDYRRELTEFSQVFLEIVQTRTPGETLQNRKLDSVQKTFREDYRAISISEFISISR